MRKKIEHFRTAGEKKASALNMNLPEDMQLRKDKWQRQKEIFESCFQGGRVGKSPEVLKAEQEEREYAIELREHMKTTMSQIGEFEDNLSGT